MGTTDVKEQRQEVPSTFLLQKEVHNQEFSERESQNFCTPSVKWHFLKSLNHKVYMVLT